MKKRAHVFIFGFVQGVSFRSFIQREAIIKNVAGWTRNLPDGRVEAVLEGEESDVKSLIELCKIGPMNALVENTDIEWEDYTGLENAFKIRYR